MDKEQEKDYQNWIEKTLNILHENEDRWEEIVALYHNYALQMLENKDAIHSDRQEFRKWGFDTYLCIAYAKSKGARKFDLRHLGQSVGTVIVSKKGVNLRVNKQTAKHNKEFFGCDMGEINTPWNSRIAANFRKYFETCTYEPRQREHMFECALFSELEKKKRSQNKKIPYIQPVKFAETRIHMKTPLKASKACKGKIELSKKLGIGGDIDIFCRRGIGKQNRLAVIEVKDENKSSESFDKAMKQAISYAIFIRELIRSKAGDDWLKLWDYKNPQDYRNGGIKLDCVVAMPEGTTKPSYNGEKLYISPNDNCKDSLELHYITFPANFDNKNSENIVLNSSYECDAL